MVRRDHPQIIMGLCTMHHMRLALAVAGWLSSVLEDSGGFKGGGAVGAPPPPLAHIFVKKPIFFRV